MDTTGPVSSAFLNINPNTHVVLVSVVISRLSYILVFTNCLLGPHVLDSALVHSQQQSHSSTRAEKLLSWFMSDLTAPTTVFNLLISFFCCSPTSGNFQDRKSLNVFSGTCNNTRSDPFLMR